MIACGICARAFAAGEIGPEPEAGAEAEEDGGGGEGVDFCSEAAVAEFFDSGFPRDEKAKNDHWDGKEGNKGVGGLAVELDVAIDAFGVGVESVEGLDDADKEHDQRDGNPGVYGNEDPVEERVPAGVWVACPHYPLRKQQIHHEQQHNTREHEDVRSDCYPNIHRSCSPDYAHNHGDYPRHAITEHHAAHDEFVLPMLVDLEYGHVGAGGYDVKDKEDGADGYVGIDRRNAAEGCRFGRVGSGDRSHACGLVRKVSCWS